MAFIWMPQEGFGTAFAQDASADEIALCGGRAEADRGEVHSGAPRRSLRGRRSPPGTWSPRRIG